MKPYQRWIVLPDLQIPYHDPKALAAVEAYMKDVQKSRNPFVGWLQLGDFLDLDELSRWNQGYEASIEGNLQRSFDAGNEFLDRHAKIMQGKRKKRNFKMIIIQGNHDFRTVDYGKKHPHMREHCDFEKNLNLKERRIQYVKFWETDEMVRLGKAHFCHGRFTNKYHAAKMVDTYGVCVYYGHTHDVMEMPKVLRGDDSTLVGKSLGTLCLYNQKYLKGAPTNWQQSFSEFFIFPDGNFQEVTHKLFNHKFMGLNGKVYRG